MVGKVNWYKTLVWGVFLGWLITLSGPRCSQGNIELVPFLRYTSTPAHGCTD